MIIHNEQQQISICRVHKDRLVTRRNWKDSGDTKIRSNFLTRYPDVLDKRFYSLSYVKRKV